MEFTELALDCDVVELTEETLVVELTEDALDWEVVELTDDWLVVEFTLLAEETLVVEFTDDTLVVEYTDEALDWDVVELTEDVLDELELEEEEELESGGEVANVTMIPAFLERLDPPLTVIRIVLPDGIGYVISYIPIFVVAATSVQFSPADRLATSTFTKTIARSFAIVVRADVEVSSVAPVPVAVPVWSIWAIHQMIRPTPIPSTEQAFALHWMTTLYDPDDGANSFQKLM